MLINKQQIKEYYFYVNIMLKEVLFMVSEFDLETEQ